MWTYAQWVRQVYLGFIPLYPIGYLTVHCFRDDHNILAKLYVKRSSLQPSDQLKELVEREMDRLEEIQHPKIRVFLTEKLEPKVYGSFLVKPGAEIQFPVSASIVDIEYAQRLGGNIEMDFGRARDRRVLESNTEIAEEVLCRMLLSEKAKRFLVQRELRQANDGILFCLPMLAWSSLCLLGYPLLIALSPALGPSASFALSLAGVTAAFREALRKLDAFAIFRMDEETTKIGEEYEEGAREYLQAQMAVARILKKVMGAEGDKRITSKGDLIDDVVSYSARLRALDRIKLMNSQ